MRKSRVDTFLRDFDQLLVTEGDRLLLADLRQDLLKSDYDFADIILHQLLNDELFDVDELLFGEFAESDESVFDAFDMLHFHGKPITKRLWQYEIADILRERLVEYTNSHYYRTKIARRYSELED